MTVEEAIFFLDNLVYEQTEKHLSRLQQSIIRGVVGGLTYQEIQENDPIARGYTVGYLGRYVGYNLWKDLTKVLRIPELLARFEEDRYFYLVDLLQKSFSSIDLLQKSFLSIDGTGSPAHPTRKITLVGWAGEPVLIIFQEV